MPSYDKKPPPAGMLVNNLSVADARHLLRLEGGELRTPQVVIRLVTIAAVAATCAYAIVVGHATAWHLALPMLAQYLVLLVLMPIVYAVLRLEGMRKDAIGSVRLLAILAVILAIVVAVRAWREDHAWMDQFTLDARWLVEWITSHKMQWPMLCAVAGTLMDFPGRVANLIKFGPPFSAVGLGCGMRIAVLFLGLFILPFIMESPTLIAWFFWATLVAAEVLAVGMHLDIQRRLRKRDAEEEH